MQRVGFIRGIYVWGVISNRGVCHSTLSGARGILKNAEQEQVGHILNRTVKTRRRFLLESFCFSSSDQSKSQLFKTYVYFRMKPNSGRYFSKGSNLFGIFKSPNRLSVFPIPLGSWSQWTVVEIRPYEMRHPFKNEKKSFTLADMLFFQELTHRPRLVKQPVWAMGILLLYVIIWGLKTALKYAKMRDCPAQIRNKIGKLMSAIHQLMLNNYHQLDTY